jgi:hypothetical protein
MPAKEIAPKAPHDHGLRLWFISFVSAFLLFGTTTAPDVLMTADSGQYQLWTFLFPELPLSAKPPDLVRLHLPYYFFSKLFGLIPFGTFAWRINLLSAFCGALTVANVVILTGKLWKYKWSPILAALVLCFGHTLWAFAVAAEILTMMAACITFEMLLWTRYERTRSPAVLLSIALLSGFGTAIHHQIGLNAFVYFSAVVVLVKRKRIKPAYLITWPAVWCIGSLPDLLVLVHFAVKTHDPLFMFKSYAVGVFAEDMARVSLTTIRNGLASLALNYPTGMILLMLPGTMKLLKAPTNTMLVRIFLAVLAFHFLFPMTYAVADQYSFFLPFYALASVVIGIGATPWLQRVPLRLALMALAILPVSIYFAGPHVFRWMRWGHISQPAPYHDPNSFFLRPWKHDISGQRSYLEEVFKQLPENTAFLSGEKIGYILKYGQTVEGRRKDILLRVAPPELIDLLEWDDPDQPARWRRPVYASGPTLVPGYLHVKQHCDFSQEGIVWKVAPPRNPQAWLREIQPEIEKMKSKM